MYLGVQPVSSDSTEPSACSIAFLEKQSLLKIKVNKDDSIEMEGRLNTKEPNPMIVIGFENNRDGYSNIKQQIESLKIALTYLLDHYHFTEFKAVGHPNGGLVLTGLLESGF